MKILLMAGAKNFDVYVKTLTLASLPAGQMWPGYLATEIRKQIREILIQELGISVVQIFSSSEDIKPVSIKMNHLYLIGWLAVVHRYHDTSIGN